MCPRKPDGCGVTTRIPTDVILTALRGLLERHGYLSSVLINGSPGVPSALSSSGASLPFNSCLCPGRLGQSPRRDHLRGALAALAMLAGECGPDRRIQEPPGAIVLQRPERRSGLRHRPLPTRAPGFKVTCRSLGNYCVAPSLAVDIPSTTTGTTRLAQLLPSPSPLCQAMRIGETVSSGSPPVTLIF